MEMDRVIIWWESTRIRFLQHVKRLLKKILHVILLLSYSYTFHYFENPKYMQMTSWILNYHTMEAALRGIFKLINLEVDRKCGPILKYPHCNVGHQFEAPSGDHLRDLSLLCISISGCLPEVWLFKYVKCGRKVRLPTLLHRIIKSEGGQ